MQSVELTARREALGLGSYALADYLDVRRNNIMRWEEGRNPPKDWGWLDEALTKLEAYRDHLTKTMVDVANESFKTEGTLELVTYSTNDHYWAWIAEARERHIPVGLHRAATALAANQLRSQHQMPVPITRAPWTD